VQDAEAGVGEAGVAAVGVAEDEDGVAGGPGVDVVGDLLEVGGSRGQVAGFGAGAGQLGIGVMCAEKEDLPSIGVDVVDVDIHPVGRCPAHERKSLWSETVRP
jgi:hypothetical protein